MAAYDIMTELTIAEQIKKLEAEIAAGERNSPQRLYTRDVDLTKMPVPTVDSYAYPGSQITIGDLHGNALKLIFMLIQHGIASNITQDDYGKLSCIYHQKELTQKNIDELISIISKLELRNDVTIRLIGDVLADRGSNDYFTLKVLEKLRQKTVPVTILFSNHDEQIIRKFELRQEFNNFDISEQQVVSATRLQNLIDNQNLNVSREEVDNLIRSAYKPYLKLIDYSYDAAGNLLDYHTHAPIGMAYKLCLISELNNGRILEPGKIYIDEKNRCCSVLDPFGYRWDNIPLAGINLSNLAQRLNESTLRKSILEKTSQAKCRDIVDPTNAKRTIAVGCTPRVTVQDLAEHMGVTYADHNAPALMQTFDRINEVFGYYVKADLIHVLYNATSLGDHDIYGNCEDGNPINSIAWSRNEYIYMPSQYCGYGLRMSYGHTGERKEIDPPHIIKLNNELGSVSSFSGPINSGKYSVLYTPPGRQIPHIQQPPARTQNLLRIIYEINFSKILPYNKKSELLFETRNKLNTISMSPEERHSLCTLIDRSIQIDFLDRLENLDSNLTSLIEKLAAFSPEKAPGLNEQILREKWIEECGVVFQELKCLSIISPEQNESYKGLTIRALFGFYGKSRTEESDAEARQSLDLLISNLTGFRRHSRSIHSGILEIVIREKMQQQAQQLQLQQVQQLQLQQLQPQQLQPQQLQLQQLQPQQLQPQQLQSEQKIQKAEEIKRQLQQLDQSLKQLQEIQQEIKQEKQKLKQKTQPEQLQKLEEVQKEAQKQEKIVEEKVGQLKIQLQQQLEPLQQPAVSHIETTPRQAVVGGMTFFRSHDTWAGAATPTGKQERAHGIGPQTFGENMRPCI